MTNTDELIYGLHAVATALRDDSSVVVELWVQQARHDKRVANILGLAKHRDVVVHRISREALDGMVRGARHQGIVARAGSNSAQTLFDLNDLNDLVAKHGNRLLLLILDGVQDPHNLGACIRTADAAGAHAVVAPKDRAVGVNATVRKVACGAAESVPFIRVTNLSRALRQLREAGVWIVGTSDQAVDTLFDADLRGPVAMVMGSEGSGLRRLTAENCDVLVRIPMVGVVESLNVSVAAGICLYEVVRQRQKAA